MKLRDLNKGEFLFTSSDNFSDSYFFLLRGKIELVVPSGEDYKFSRALDEGLIFV